MSESKQNQNNQNISEPKLNPNAVVFIPSYKKRTPATQTTEDASNIPSLNPNAPVFKPVFAQSKPAEKLSPVKAMPTISNPTNSLAALAGDPMNGYVNKFVQKSMGQQQMAERRQQVGSEEQGSYKVYSIQLMLSLKDKNKEKPQNMALLDFPHKRKKRIGVTETDRFNQAVREIRVLLNKLSRDNFDNVARQIMTQYQYTPSLLNELMKIIFMKATTEATYLHLYVQLCLLLFRKFNDKENKEMNFKKLLLAKCQKQFYRLLQKEEVQRRSRRQSQADGELNKSPNKEIDQDFNKQMQLVFDKDELLHRQKLQLYGNMKLLAELYCNNCLNESILHTCFENLFDEINDQNVEILCYMITKVTSYCIETAQNEQKENSKESKRVKKLRDHQINLGYVENLLSKLFAYRKSELISVRVRFMIQDVIDQYNREWRDFLMQGQGPKVDAEGFQYQYVNKEAIITVDNISPGQKRHSRRNSKHKEQQYIYVKKASPPQPRQQSQPKSPMKSLLQNLRPNSPSEDDEDVSKVINRRVSMNEQNVIGMNFEKYNEMKPSQEIRRKIGNFFLEFQNNKDKEEAKHNFIEICEETRTKFYIFYGYILNNAYSQAQQGWDEIFSLIIDYFYKSEQLLSDNDLIEGMNVSFANFTDTLVDYPNSKDYAFQMLEKFNSLGIMTSEKVEKYKQHIENLLNDDYEY